MRQFEPGHRPPATPTPAPPRRKPRNELKPAAAFRGTIGGAQLRHPTPASISDLNPDNAAPSPDRDRHRLTGITRPAMPHAIAEKLAHEQGGVIPARVPGTEDRVHERAGGPRPLRPPARPPSHSPVPPAQSSVHLPSPVHRPRPGKPRGTASGYRGMHAPFSGPRQAGTRRRNGPSVAVRGKPTVPPTVLTAQTPSAYLHRAVTSSGSVMAVSATALRVQEFDEGRGPVGLPPIG